MERTSARPAGIHIDFFLRLPIFSELWAFIASELGVDVATVELDSFEKERVFREMGSAVESKFERVGMARWFGHAESIDGLLNLWSGRLCILFHYLIMTGMPLEEHACQTRPKAPQIHLPRDFHTLTTFWCYQLSFVADFCD